MRNHIIIEIALGLAMVAVAIFVLAQPAVAASGGTSSSHGSSLGTPSGNPSGQGPGNMGNPVIHPNVKPIKTERQCQRNCKAGGMNRDFCLLACAGY